MRCFVWSVEGAFAAVVDDGLVVFPEEFFASPAAIGFLVNPFSTCRETKVRDFQMSISREKKVIRLLLATILRSRTLMSRCIQPSL